MATKLLVALSLLASTAPRDTPANPTVGLYAPPVQFGTAQARLAYAQGLARSIEQATGIDTEAQSYATLSALEKDRVDFAIIDGPCIATRPNARMLATANVGGGTTRSWALFSSAGASMTALRGKKLAYVAAGCSDAAFIDNAMFESELDASFFAARVAEKDLSGAIASVTSYRTAHAVFAPYGSAKGLTKVFDAGTIPNPAFVALSTSLPDSLVDKVAVAVLGHSGSGAITAWSRPPRDAYQALAARLAPLAKTAMFATPEPARLDPRGILIVPATLAQPGPLPVRQHFVRPPGLRME